MSFTSWGLLRHSVCGFPVPVLEAKYRAVRVRALSGTDAVCGEGERAQRKRVVHQLAARQTVWRLSAATGPLLHLTMQTPQTS